MDIPSYLLGKKSSGGGSGDLDWTALGYEGRPQSIDKAYAYALEIKNNWEIKSSYLNEFYKDTNLVYMPLVDTSDATNAGSMFQDCTQLVEMPLLDTSKITNSQSMFNNCSALEKLPLFDFSSVTLGANTFTYCSKIKVAPAFNFSKATSLASMFQNDISLEEVKLINTSNASLMNSMFSGCLNLKIVPILDTSRMTNCRNMFLNCPSLTDESLNNILQMCINAVNYSTPKTLVQLGFSSDNYPASRIQALSNYTAFTNAGWTIGY